MAWVLSMQLLRLASFTVLSGWCRWQVSHLPTRQLTVPLQLTLLLPVDRSVGECNSFSNPLVPIIRSMFCHRLSVWSGCWIMGVQVVTETTSVELLSTMLLSKARYETRAYNKTARYDMDEN